MGNPNPSKKWTKETAPKSPGNAGSKWFTTQISEALAKIAEGEKTPGYQQAVEKIRKMIINGNVDLIKLLWAYLDGKPQEKVDVTSDGQKIMGFNFVNPETNNSNEIND